MVWCTRTEYKALCKPGINCQLVCHVTAHEMLENKVVLLSDSDIFDLMELFTPAVLIFSSLLPLTLPFISL